MIDLSKEKDFVSKRISSYDRTGGNNDRISIESGKTAVLAEIKGPAAIHHIWITVAGEPFYGRKIILKMYWDGGKKILRLRVPLGDFFGVGHGLNRNVNSLPIVCSSEGRARNCYWYMPFRNSARITVTNEGTETVGAFYYYIDYRELPKFESDTFHFHAQYRQEMPCKPGVNYEILNVQGKGHYVGCNLSILQGSMGWWGEGDDMIFVDGEKTPSLHGTGSEDYFCDAWGMRESNNPFYGCTLQEPDFKTGAKATVYRYHIPDPIPFKESIKVTIEHGHANDRDDYLSSVAYWYQKEPHIPFPALPPLSKRLPFALKSQEEFQLPEWEREDSKKGICYTDPKSGISMNSLNMSLSLASFYNQAGTKYPVLLVDGNHSVEAVLSLNCEISEQYNIDFYFLKGPSMGNILIKTIEGGNSFPAKINKNFSGYNNTKKLSKVSLKNILLHKGQNKILIEITGKEPHSSGKNMAFSGIVYRPSNPHYIRNWNLIGPFDAPDMSYLQTSYPPEAEINLKKVYKGKNGKLLRWKEFKTSQSGYVRLDNYIIPPEKGIVYGHSYIYSDKPGKALMFVGSDDGVRIWFNDKLVHTNPAYRGAYPDQDKIYVNLKKGWNTLLIKVLQGAGGWGYYVRFVDPDKKFKYNKVMVFD